MPPSTTLTSQPTPSKPHACPSCPLTFRRAWHLKRHRMRHTRPPTTQHAYNLPQNPTPTTSTSTPNATTSTPGPPKPESGTHIPKANPTTGDRPSSTATGPPFICPLCSKGLARSDTLLRHLGVHRRRGEVDGVSSSSSSSSKSPQRSSKGVMGVDSNRGAAGGGTARGSLRKGGRWHAAPEPQASGEKGMEEVRGQSGREDVARARARVNASMLPMELFDGEVDEQARGWLRGFVRAEEVEEEEERGNG